MTQLYSYKFAMENPNYGKKINISQLALLIFYPNEVEFKDGKAIFSFPHRYLEVPLDEKGFFGFINKVNKLLLGPLPAPSENCKWCQYRKKFKLGENTLF
jgi:hypothetical protein